MAGEFERYIVVNGTFEPRVLLVTAETPKTFAAQDRWRGIFEGRSRRIFKEDVVAEFAELELAERAVFAANNVRKKYKPKIDEFYEAERGARDARLALLNLVKTESNAAIKAEAR